MIKNLIARIKYFLKHGKDDYGKRGFTQLVYKGLPILNTEIEKNDLFMLNGDFSFRYPKKKDGTKDMRYKINKRFYINRLL